MFRLLESDCFIFSLHLIDSQMKNTQKNTHTHTFELEKNATIRITDNNEKPLAYVANYNHKSPGLFREIIRKHLKNLKTMTKIKILDTTKIIKSQKQSKNLKWILTSSTLWENKTQGVTKCKKKKDVKYVI